MLVCLNCNVEYEEERRYCKYCGEPLVPKSEPDSTQKKASGTDTGKAIGKLICPDCQIIYEFGTACIQCGSALAPNISPGEKEELKSNHKETAEERGFLKAKIPKEQRMKKESKEVRKLDMEEKTISYRTIREPLIRTPQNKLICPACKIIYERGEACIRCGLKLVSQLSLQEEEKSKLQDPPEVDLEPSLLPSLEIKDFGNVERAGEKEGDAPPVTEVELKEDPLLTEAPEHPPTPKRLEDDFKKKSSVSKKRKINYRRLFLEAGTVTVMAVAGGYFLWSVYSHMSKENGSKRLHSKVVSRSALLTPSMATNESTPASIPKENDQSGPKENPTMLPTPSDAVVAETLELEKIKRMLENIRQANLKKDIDLFLACYSADFKDREEKRKATLDNWKKFDYLDLSYDLKNPSISDVTARAKVEWLIKIFRTTGGKPLESKTILDVLLKKEEGEWKIKEVKQGG